MPRYDYDCSACGESSEIIHDVSGVDNKRRKCPLCGEAKLTMAFRQVAAYHTNVSPMHPRVGRGKGITGKYKKPVPNPIPERSRPDKKPKK